MAHSEGKVYRYRCIFDIWFKLKIKYMIPVLLSKLRLCLNLYRAGKKLTIKLSEMFGAEPNSTLKNYNFNYFTKLAIANLVLASQMSHLQ
jgi:hypothetical protein